MVTSYERYKKHPTWETLTLKRDSLHAARFDDKSLEQWRNDIVEWLDEALKTQAATRKPALYLTVLDDLGTALNQLPVDKPNFNQFIANRPHAGHGFQLLLQTLRALPLPPPKDLGAGYVELLDKEVVARTQRLGELQQRVSETETALKDRLSELANVTRAVEKLTAEIQEQRKAIAGVSEAAKATIDAEWKAALDSWSLRQEETDAKNDAEAVAHIGTLAATAKAGEALAEHAAGDLSATDWYGRAKRERGSAHWMRVGAFVAFLFAGAVGYYIVSEAIEKNFQLTIGDGILRLAVAVVIGAFGALLLREAGRHFREADTAEDVALSLRALAPFYANSDEGIRLAARVQLGDAVLVKNVLSRFSHRDAAKHAGEVKTEELPGIVREATNALKLAESAGAKS